MGKKDKDRENLLRAIVVCHVEPFTIFSFDPIPRWYVEGKILFSDKQKAIGYLDGKKVQWKVKAVKFRRILDNPKTIDKLLKYVRENVPGAHHVNLYYGVSRRFKKPSLKIQ